jgi:hypothetical protein
MVCRLLADAVVVVHLVFILFVAVGGLLAWRWPWLVWVHVPCVLWGVAIIVIGFDCPLTPLEKWLRERGGEDSYGGGFVDRYVEGVVYPERFTPHLRALALVLIVVAYARLVAGTWSGRHRGSAIRASVVGPPVRDGGPDRPT